MSIKTIESLVNQVKVISFDIFDTLIVRTYKRPTDVFQHIGESRGNSSFMLARIEAERLAREKAKTAGIHEVKIEDIYQEIHPSYRPFMEEEISQELETCRPDPIMMQVYRSVLEKGKRIIISTDMYLPRPTIERILSDAGYAGYERLFLSCETMRPKSSGEMYADICGYAGVSPEEILHIGDHPYTDGEMARRYGIKTYRYVPIREQYGSLPNSAFFGVLNRHQEESVVPSIMQGLISLYTAQGKARSQWENVGYQYAGIIAVAYAQWLYREMQKEGIKKAFFCLRDGYIFKQVFQSLYPDFPTQEIYCSRRMLLFAGMRKLEDIGQHLYGDWMYGWGKLTFEQYWDSLSIKDESLAAAFQERFPQQKKHLQKIDQQSLKQFFLDHEKELLRIGAEERAVLLEYYNGLSLGESHVALVDLGWKASMLKGIESLYALSGQRVDLIGYYLGTHMFTPNGIRAEGFALNFGQCAGWEGRHPLLDYGYIIPVLELLFSAPIPSTIKMKQQDGAIQPVYAAVCGEEQERMNASLEIASGVLEFTRDFMRVTKKLSVIIAPDVALLPLKYLMETEQPRDRDLFGSQYLFPEFGEDVTHYPISRFGRPSIGIINPFPGAESAEMEIITRMIRTAKELGFDMVALENGGVILNETQQKTGAIIDAEQLDFVITTHYETPKVLDSFYYHTVWNPPEIPLNTGYYVERVTNQYLMNDDFLIYDSGGMSEHLKSVLWQKPRNLENASLLIGTFPESAMLEPKLHEPTLFYCGMNWEKVVHNSNRHDGLFKLLDRTGKVKFYGPDVVESWGGLRPWEGYKCYQHPIPFDGFSILKEINDCGVCLVLSSDAHRRAGSATNRLYEACAAGAVIISDDNEFVMKWFKDAALFIRYNRANPQDTFGQIMEKYQWIIDHPQEAQHLARKAQEIFRNHFALDKQMMDLVNNHSKRVEQIKEDLFAKDDTGTVLVTYVCNTQDLSRAKEHLIHVLKNIERQYYRKIKLVVAADFSIAADVEKFCQKQLDAISVVPMPLFDQCGVRSMTDGMAILELRKRFEHAYFMNTVSSEEWFSDHVTTLVRTIEDEHAVGAYSGSCRRDKNGYTRVEFFDMLSQRDAYDSVCSPKLQLPGQFLFVETTHAFLPDYLFSSIDGREHLAYLLVCVYRMKLSVAFSKRMTFAAVDYRQDERNKVLDCDRERRFLMDIVRFDVPHVSSNTVQPFASSMGNEDRVIEMLSLFPVKLWLKLRWLRFRLRHAKAGTEKGKRINESYQAALNQYLDFWKK